MRAFVQPQVWPVRSQKGFTLIELILVMAMMLTAISLVAPSLGRFFRGRNLDSEARRFLALTRYGQSRAVSEGVPMVLWIDGRLGTYGLQTEASYTEEDTKAVQFEADKNLRVEVAPAVANRQLQLQAMKLPTSPGLANLPLIRFTPDGSINETSPYWISFRDVKEPTSGAQLWVAQSRNRLNYEIQTNEPPVIRP